MDNFKQAYKNFATAITETIENCGDNLSCLEKLLSKFRTANVLPRAILYKSLAEDKQKIADMVQRTFSREISALMTQYIQQGDCPVDQNEIAREIEVWHEIWRERERERVKRP